MTEPRCPRCDAAINLVTCGRGWYVSDCCGRPFAWAPWSGAPVAPIVTRIGSVITPAMRDVFGELGRRGGVARAAALSPARRAAIARRGGVARARARKVLDG